MNKLARDFTEQPSAADIRAGLDRIVASPCFIKSPQLANFIRFIVDETLAGRGGRIKAYTIAADALGRDDSFDPQTDAIVRVEAGRLRRALDCYYSREGRRDPIMIEMPVGHYAPVFRHTNKPRRVMARLNRMRGQISDALRENSRLVPMVIAIAVAVSLTLNLLGSLLTNAIWPAISAPRSQPGIYASDGVHP